MSYHNSIKLLCAVGIRICVILFFPVNNSYAQNYFTNEKQFEPDALQAPSVERVGAVPLPIQNFGTLPVSAANQIMETPKINSVKKGSFESTYMPGRIIYLNGENISSVRNQELESVNIRIDKSGNLYIEAPQYEVSSEQSYHPLLPKELPKFKKENVYEQMSLPSGVYSKQTGKSALPAEVEPSAETPPAMAKEIVPEINSKSTIPAVNLDGIKHNKSNTEEDKK